ncbi:MAG: IS3 family transposase [Sulfurimonas sp.]|nr:IS3 family transposase [Sulfurimonas sp.]
MSRKRTVYTAEYKTRLVLEVLKEEKTLAEIASANKITPLNLQNWKKIFLANAELAMEPSKAIKEYKEANAKLVIEVGEYAKKVGQLTIEKDWLVEKLKDLGLSKKLEMVDESKSKVMSVVKQCELLHLSRSNIYYAPVVNEHKLAIKEEIKAIFEEIPIYGAKKVHCQLKENGFNVSLNTVTSYRKELGLRAILAVREPTCLTQPNIAHPKHSYKLRGLGIVRANQVWSTDITYIKIAGGMVYLAAVIDWYSKAVLSWRISNTMDTALVMDVLDEALLKYGKPEIFNTDQGSQYTSYVHTQKLKDNGIIISMDGVGRATDNIAIERFWRSAKVERIYLNQYNTIKELKEDVADYMQFYNYRRFHETLDYKKPMNVYFESLKINKEIFNTQEKSVA